jgi:CheY-like chemotaxis protein
MGATLANLAVLLVDDDALQAITTREALLSLGCNPVAWATNWEQATRMAAIIRPHIFVVEAYLNTEADGISVVERLRHRYRAPVVLLAEEAEVGTTRRAANIRAATLLVRPYSRDELAAALREALELASAAYLRDT